MKTKHILIISLTMMGGLIVFAVFFREIFVTLLNQPTLHIHVLFVHVTATTLFFANAVVGML